MSSAEKKPAKPKASLVAAANQPTPPSATSTTASTSNPMQRAATVGSSSTASGSARSTPALPEGSSSAPAPGPAKLKFRPKVPVRKVKAEPDVKPEIPAPTDAPMRGGMRGRGRGGPGGRGGRSQTQQHQSNAVGIFGGPRNPVGNSNKAVASTGTRTIFDDDVPDVYSDDEETGTSSANIVDISAVSGLGESAPTSLIRAGRETGKAKEELEEQKRIKKERARKGKERARPRVEEHDDERIGGGMRVKPEPVSPEKRALELNEGVIPPIGLREDDVMMDEDLSQDRDIQGRRLNGEGEDVNEAQKVDLSESEDEEEEESMEGDFVSTDGYDDPSSKLYLFQFPKLFPNFITKQPVDLTQDNKPDIKPDLKPSDAELRAANGPGKKKKPVIPQGRIGSLVVMKSGKVKVVMGDDIVMNMTPGVPCTFLQHLVHLDTPKKSINVLGEVNKHYVITPDVDRLLKELWLNDGETHGEKQRKMAPVKLDDPLPDALMAMDDD